MSFRYHGEVIANAATGTTDAEAYAVGTRDGVDVVKTDKTYHNNAKYYASLLGTSARDAAASAELAASYASFAQEAKEAAELAENNAEEYSRGVSRYATEAEEYAAEAAAQALIAEEGANIATQQSSSAQDAADKAKQYAETAQAVTGINVSSQTQLGILKGGDNYITPEGVLQLIGTANGNTLEHSYKGGLKIVHLRGHSQQAITPTVESNQAIQQVSINRIVVMNKNILDYSWIASATENGAACTNNNDNTWTFSGSIEDTSLDTRFQKSFTQETTPVQFKQPGFYYLSLIGDELDVDTNQFFYLNLYYNGAAVQNMLRSGAIYSLEITEEMLQYDDFYVESIGWCIAAGGEVKSGTFGVQIEYSNNAIESSTDFVKHEHNSVELSTSVYLNGIDFVVDELISDERRFGQMTYDGTEVWEASGSVEGRYLINPSSAKGGGSVMCTHAVMTNDGGQVVNSCFINSNETFCINTPFATVEEWTAHLATNPMTIVYELAQSTNFGLSNTDKAALRNLVTYQDYTHVYIESDVQPDVEFEYGTSKVGGYTIDAHNKVEIILLTGGSL